MTVVFEQFLCCNKSVWRNTGTVNTSVLSVSSFFFSYFILYLEINRFDFPRGFYLLEGLHSVTPVTKQQKSENDKGQQTKRQPQFELNQPPKLDNVLYDS